MFKILSLFIILSITGYITIWIKKHPGEIAIEWQGWLIETSVPVIVSITLQANLISSGMTILFR